MDYQEKKTIALIFSEIVIISAYCLNAYLNYQQFGQEILGDLNFWAKRMLIFFVIGIAATIIILIIFHILLAISIEAKKEYKKTKGRSNIDCHNEKNSSYEQEEDDYDFLSFEDERDKLIALKANRIAFVFVGISFVTGLFTLLLNIQPAIMLNIVYLSFMIGALLESLMQLYFYRRGI